MISDVMKKEVARLLTTQKGLLSPLDQQRKFLVYQYAHRNPCPGCDAPTSILEAATDDWSIGNDLPVMVCPNCQASLRHTVPLMVFGPIKWAWRMVRAVDSSDRGGVTRTDNG